MYYNLNTKAELILCGEREDLLCGFEVCLLHLVREGYSEEDAEAIISLVKDKVEDEMYSKKVLLQLGIEEILALEDIENPHNVYYDYCRRCMYSVREGEADDFSLHSVFVVTFDRRDYDVLDEWYSFDDWVCRFKSRFGVDPYDLAEEYGSGHLFGRDIARRLDIPIHLYDDWVEEERKEAIADSIRYNIEYDTYVDVLDSGEDYV